MSTDLGPTIDSAAQNPQSATADGVTAASHPIPALIQADRYGKARSAAGNKMRGVMFNKLVASGPVSDQQGTQQGQDTDFNQVSI